MRVSKVGRHFVPDKQRTYAQKISWLAEQRMHGLEEMKGPIQIQMRATYAYPVSWPEKKKLATTYKTTKPDCDNLIKIVADSLNGIVYRDDVQIVRVSASKQYGQPEGLTITVSEIEHEQVSPL